MPVLIRSVQDRDKNGFIELSVKLSLVNRNHHANVCKTDDFQNVLEAIREKAEQTFLQRNDDILILMAEVDGNVCGYDLGRIINEEPCVENGTGRMGLFDEFHATLC